MDPIFRFYASPNFERAGGIQAGKGGSRAIPVYEGYGFLSSLANRVFYPVLRNAGRDLLERGLNYMGERAAGKLKRGAGIEFDGVDESPSPDDALPPPAKKRRKKRSVAISKRRRSRKQAGQGLRKRLRRKKPRKTRLRGKVSASRNLFRLLDRK